MRHDKNSANLILKEKGLSDILLVISIKDNRVYILDQNYGEYIADIKCLCPNTKVPLHKKRKFFNRLNALKAKYIGQKIREALITNIFYGPDRGYKNRSFYFEYIGDCQHLGIAPYASLTRHKKTFQCQSCLKTQHGERKKVDGVLKKRTSTYNHWQRIKDTLPEKYKDFSKFKEDAGDKPYKIAELRFLGEKPVWVSLQASLEEYDLGLMVTALRQAFRHSSLYRDCLEKAKIETEEGTRYECADCKGLFKRSEVQVDHIDPVSNLDGSLLKKEEIIDKVFTKNIQVLHKKCHTKKSSLENKIRRKNKEKK